MAREREKKRCDRGSGGDQFVRLRQTNSILKYWYVCIIGICVPAENSEKDKENLKRGGREKRGSALLITDARRMITPRFEVTQDDTHLHIKIYITSIRFSADAVEVNVTGNLFIFYLSPYYLRLRFDQQLRENVEDLEGQASLDIPEDEKLKLSFVPHEDCILVDVPKLNKGEVFQDLDLPTKLLARFTDNATHGSTAESKGPMIQEVGDNSVGESVESIAKLGEAFNWEVEQSLNTFPHNTDNSNSNGSLLGYSYGFNNSYSSVIGVSLSNGNDINELDEPERTSPDERVKERIRKENWKFDPEYYVSEYMTLKYGDPEELEINGIQKLLKFVPRLAKKYLKWYKEDPSAHNDIPMTIQFTKEETQSMQDNLPHKEYFIDQGMAKLSYITVLSVLFSYNYEQIENEDTHNTESAWTIGKLTPQISCLDQQLVTRGPASDESDNLHPSLMIVEPENSTARSGHDHKGVTLIRAAIIAGLRRALSFPLHRNFELAMKAWMYTYYLLRGGKRLVTEALLDIHEVFRFHDVYYVYNRVLLDDLCSWFINSGDENVIKSLAIDTKRELDTISRDEIEFDCVAEFDKETGEPVMENMTIREMEIIAESQYRERLEKGEV